MPRKVYRLSVLLCASSWMLVGLHIPVLHDFTHAESSPRWGVLALTVAFLILAIADTWALLRAPAPWVSTPPVEPPAA